MPLDRAPSRRLATVVAAAALLVAACGEDDEGSGPRPATTVPAGQTVKIVGTEYAFEPEKVATAARRRPLRISFTNEGALAHNLRLFRAEDEIGGTNTFQNGKSETVELDLPVGTYRMVCTVGDHEDLGMTGTLEVK